MADNTQTSTGDAIRDKDKTAATGAKTQVVLIDRAGGMPGTEDLSAPDSVTVMYLEAILMECRRQTLLLAQMAGLEIPTDLDITGLEFVR